MWPCVGPRWKHSSRKFAIAGSETLQFQVQQWHDPAPPPNPTAIVLTRFLQLVRSPSQLWVFAFSPITVTTSDAHKLLVTSALNKSWLETDKPCVFLFLAVIPFQNRSVILSLLLLLFLSSIVSFSVTNIYPRVRRRAIAVWRGVWGGVATAYDMRKHNRRVDVHVHVSVCVTTPDVIDKKS